MKLETVEPHLSVWILTLTLLALVTLTKSVLCHSYLMKIGVPIRPTLGSCRIKLFNTQ